MKITHVEALVLRLPRVVAAADGTQDTCLIRVDTDAGITGWGEVDSCPEAVKAVVDAPLSHSNCSGLARLLVGLDPLAIEVCNHRLRTAANYYAGGGVAVHAMAGVDMALWDVAGKTLGKPIYQLLGGPFQTRFRAYSSVLFGDTPAATHDIARRWADRGFTAVKFGWGPMGTAEATDVALVREARRGLGDGIDLLVDAGECFDARTAIRRANQFAEFRPYWLEEMLHPDDLAGYRTLAAVSPTPIAAGETASREAEFLRMLDEGNLDWIQPDPSRCGISTMLAVGRAAVARHKRVCNHTFKSAVTLAASLHVMAALPGVDVVEFCMADSPLRHELTRETFDVTDGFTTISDRPGLGVTVDPATVEKYRLR
jgi:L-alanine-DL-glutamate epimerase-like enolase superfamily enzyme